MKKFATNFGISVLFFSFSVFLGSLIAAILGISTVLVDAEKNVDSTPMHSVELTQKGYIQFLRWAIPVPEIHEFTFCLWMKSTDLKYPHSIFSYSRNERERLIRSWISSRGRSIHLEIGGVEVLGRSIRIQEHRWYHICQSWENRVGRYALWLDGHLELQGHLEEIIEHVIPGGGDIVLGQEYTDFDKGLEEGIEGSVLGFNFLLASAFDSLDSGHQRPFRSINRTTDQAMVPLVAAMRTKMARRDSNLRAARALDRLISMQFALNPNWSRKIFQQSSSTISPYRLNIANGTRKEEILPIRRNAITFVDDLIGEINLSGKPSDDPLGLQLMKLSYFRCQLGRGSPPISDSLMLISWSRTPVRMFGGATIKNVGNECGKF
ncbi:Pentraxin-related protein PTX3 [Formica fusca]